MMDEKILEEFLVYLRKLVSCGMLDTDISAQYKPVVIAYFFNSEVYGEGFQGFFENFSFSLDEVLSAFQVLKVTSELIQIVEEAKTNKYLTDDELSELASNDEDMYSKLMDERDVFWDEIDRKYYSITNNDVDERIIDYIKTNGLDFSIL